LLINILLKHKLPPLNIELENRKEYYDALGAYQTTGNIRPTLELMLKEHRRAENYAEKVTTLSFNVVTHDFESGGEL